MWPNMYSAKRRFGRDRLELAERVSLAWNLILACGGRQGIAWFIPERGFGSRLAWELCRARVAGGAGADPPRRSRDGKAKGKRETDGPVNLGRAGSTPDGKDAPRDDPHDHSHITGALRSFPSFGD